MKIVNVLKLSESSLRNILDQWNQQVPIKYSSQRLLFNSQEARYIGSMLGIQWKTNPPRFKIIDFQDGLNEEMSKDRQYRDKLSVFKDKDDVLAIGKVVLHNLSIDPHYYSEQLAVSAKKQTEKERKLHNIKKVNRNVPLKPSKTILNKKDEKKREDWRWNNENVYDDDGLDWDQLDKMG